MKIFYFRFNLEIGARGRPDYFEFLALPTSVPNWLCGQARSAKEADDHDHLKLATPLAYRLFTGLC